MPLSEHEQRLLDQMEQALYAEDPRFANQMRTERAPLARKRVVLGMAAALAGLGIILLAVSMANPWVGAAGFVVMVAGVAWGLSRPHADTREGESADATNVTSLKDARKGKRKPKRSGGFMDRLESRWDDRRNDGL